MYTIWASAVLACNNVETGGGGSIPRCTRCSVFGSLGERQWAPEEIDVTVIQVKQTFYVEEV